MNERELEKILKAIANKRRVAILKYLKHIGRASVGDIAENIKLSFRATSRHLMILYSAEIIEREQKNLLVFYFLSKNTHPMISKLLTIV
jgi:DNA-binding transcriptional ArsR family regulator